jgi:hypothetical protein
VRSIKRRGSAAASGRRHNLPDLVGGGGVVAESGKTRELTTREGTHVRAGSGKARKAMTRSGKGKPCCACRIAALASR